MKHYEEQKISVADTETTFKSLYQKVQVPKEILEQIEEANVLLVPQDNFRDCNGAFFPEGTYEFYQYMVGSSKNSALNIDVCCSDEEYSEVQLHNDFIRIAELIVQNPVYDIVIGLIASYLYSKVTEMRKSKKEVTTEININVDINGKSKKISYTGDVENFEKAMTTIKEKFMDGGSK